VGVELGILHIRSAAPDMNGKKPNPLLGLSTRRFILGNDDDGRTADIGSRILGRGLFSAAGDHHADMHVGMQQPLCHFEIMIFRFATNFIMLLIVGILICGCQYKTVSTYTTFYLSDEEIEQLKHKANDGDLTATRKLAQFYTFVDYDSRSERLKWLRVLAESGLANEQHNLAYELLDSQDIMEQQEGIMWLKKAAKGGVSYSQKRLAKFYETGKILEEDLCKSIEPAHKLKIDQNKLQNCRSNILNLVNVL